MTEQLPKAEVEQLNRLRRSMLTEAIRRADENDARAGAAEDLIDVAVEALRRINFEVDSALAQIEKRRRQTA